LFGLRIHPTVYPAKLETTPYTYTKLRRKKAIQALRHEVVDHLITSRIVKPLVDLINLLIKAREAEIYKEKEKIVETISKII